MGNLSKMEYTGEKNYIINRYTDWYKSDKLYDF